MRSALICAGALFVCSAFAACSTFTADPDDSTDGGVARGDADTVPDTGSTGSTDAADASTGTDRACDGVHALCDDFDLESVGSTPDWGEAPTIDTNASMRVRGFATARSAPNVVESKAGDGSKAILSKTIAVTGGQMGASCSFSFQIFAKNEAASAATIAAMTLRLGSAAYDVDLRDDTVITTGRGADGGVQPASLQPLPAPAVGVWTPVVVSMAFGIHGSVAVDVGGARVSTVVTDPTIAVTTSPTAHLDLGVHSLSAGDSWQLLYDDVVCDLVP